MAPIDTSPGGALSSGHDPRGETGVRLRLYVARSTPNSVRAEQNLAEVLGGLASDTVRPSLEIIDVFSQSKRAFTDGVIVTPTLVGLGVGKRMILLGDLADKVQLKRLIEDLTA